MIVSTFLKPSKTLIRFYTLYSTGLTCAHLFITHLDKACVCMYTQVHTQVCMATSSTSYRHELPLSFRDFQVSFDWREKIEKSSMIE